MSPAGLALTPARLAWLQHLVTYGESSWPLMPQRANGGFVPSTTWRPMVDVGFITQHVERGTRVFAITDYGRVALAIATRIGSAT